MRESTFESRSRDSNATGSPARQACPTWLRRQDDRRARHRDVDQWHIAGEPAAGFSLTQQDFRACHRLIQGLTDAAKSANADLDAAREDSVLVRNAQAAAASKVQQLSSVFRRKQSVYLQRQSLSQPLTHGSELRGHEVRSHDLVAASGFTPVTDSLAAAADDVQMVGWLALAALTSQSRTEAQLQATQQSNTGAIDRRSKEVHDIAQSINELADLFKDLSSIVIDQGSLFDRIDYNVEQMATNVHQAASELETATRCVDSTSLTTVADCHSYQKRSGKRSLLFLLVLLVLGAILVLIYKPR